MLTIVDYGVGNIQAFVNIYKRYNIAIRVARNASELGTADRIILPGVGSFDWAMSGLEASGMRPVLDELALDKGRPTLGVCVGMQMMARSSTEGELPGLGWLDAEVKRLDDSAARARACLPHMGWNDVSARAHPLFAGLEEPCFYFLHSYYIQPVDEECTLATVDFHGTFPCAVVKKNILGVQFHPEKSHSWGIRLLRNFALL